MENYSLPPLSVYLCREKGSWGINQHMFGVICRTLGEILASCASSLFSINTSEIQNERAKGTSEQVFFLRFLFI